MHTHVGRIDDEISGLDQRVDQFAFGRDRILQTASHPCQRMTTFGFAVAAQQFGIGREHSEQLAAQTTATQLLDRVADVAEADIRITRVNADG